MIFYKIFLVASGNYVTIIPIQCCQKVVVIGVDGSKPVANCLGQGNTLAVEVGGRAAGGGEIRVAVCWFREAGYIELPDLQMTLGDARL